MKMHIRRPGTKATLCGQLAGFDMPGNDSIEADDPRTCKTCAKAARKLTAPPERPPFEETEVPPLDDGSIEMNRITIVSYIERDGSESFSLHTRGEASNTQLIGLMFRAQAMIHARITDA